jgi:hypothetical protein
MWVGINRSERRYACFGAYHLDADNDAIDYTGAIRGS